MACRRAARALCHVVDADLIDEVVEELHDLHGDAWAPIRRDDFYDEEFGVEVDLSVEPLRRLVITALESFLQRAYQRGHPGGGDH